MQEIQLQTPSGPRIIGPSHPCFIIAELSGNHNQEFERAKALIDAAVEAGVDAVKLQTYKPDLLTIDCDNEYFQIKSNDAWKGQTLYSLYSSAYTPWEWHKPLKEHAERQGVMLFSTPFSEEAVDFLEDLEVILYKVASFENEHLPLLKRIGQTKKPVIVSRGLAPLEAVLTAVCTLREAGAAGVAVLHCISDYPAKVHQMNLRTIPDIARRLDVLAGLSDHSLSPAVPIAAVAQGASIIEKHFTLDRGEGGPDAEFSLEPKEMADLVKNVRECETALGQPFYEVEKEEGSNLIFKRSIFVVEDIPKGAVLSRNNVRIIRPGHGLAPKHLAEVLGTIAKEGIKRGTPLSWDLIG